MTNEQAILARELHAPRRIHFPRRKVITLDIDDLWQADLVEMYEKRKKKGRGYNFILTVIDTFSKYAWAVPLKSKSAAEVAQAFEKIFTQSKRHPKNLQTDEGKEFFNSTFRELMNKYKINHYNTYSYLKASIAERFNRTIKEKMYRNFTEENTTDWVTALPVLMEEYNHIDKHRTINMIPGEVDKTNKHLVLKRLQTIKVPIKKSDLKVGDIVRISKAKSLFDKGYIGNWTEELFKISKVKNTVPVTYILKDMLNEPIKGTFYRQEVQKTKIPDYARIEKVLKKEKNKIFVKWKGYDNRFNSWIATTKTVKL